MFWKKTFFLLLLLQISLYARGKRRIRKRDDASADPLLAEIFKSTKPYVEPKEEHRPDRALDPGEELEALLTGFKNKNQHIFPVEGPIKRESGPEPGTNGLDQQNMMLTGNGPVVRDGIPKPDDNANLMQIPNTAFAAASPDAGQNLMQLPEQQSPGNPDASFMQMLTDQDELKKQHELQAKNFIPGRPNQMSNNWAGQPGVTVYLHQDKKSSIPIQVKTGSAAAQSKGSFPLQMRKISPNMNIGSVVPHQAEYGETVESLFKKPEDIIAKKSEIPHADESKKSDVGGKNETNQSQPAKQGDSAKKDVLQIPLMMQQQQSNAFQTTSQFGGVQGGQNAVYGQTAAATAPQPVAPAVMAQPAAAAASTPVAIPGEPCNDQYDSCVDFAKNDYCVKYPVQMSTQCRRSCKFCVAPEPKQQIATATHSEPGTVTTQFSAQGTQTNQAAHIEAESNDDGSASGSGDASGSGELPGDLPLRRSSKLASKGNAMYLPELGSGSESGSGSGDSFASGSEADVVRQLASAQNIVSGIGQEATVTAKKANNTKKSFVPLMRNALKKKLISPTVVKKSNIPQRPVSPLKAMDVENVNDDSDDDDASASGSGSGSGEEDEPQDTETNVVNKEEKSQKKSEISKKSEILKAPALPQISAYPRIDLRKIASALANYEEAALTLAGEYPRITSQDTDVFTRSHIPHPSLNSPFNKLKQNIQIAKLVTQNNNKRFEIPKYLLVGDQITEKDGLAKESSLPSADTYESVTQRFAIPGVKPSLQEYYAETGKPLFESEAAKRMRITKRKKKKFQKPVDPFEYLRNMPAGASMEPIVDPHSVASTRQSVSYPVYLMKVMPGSHKYVAASARSKVNPVPKKPETKANVAAAATHGASTSSFSPEGSFASMAPAAPQKQAVMTENPNAKSEFDSGPGPEFDSAQQHNDQDAASQMEIELGPAKEQSAIQEAPLPNQPITGNGEAIQENFENQRERPALRTKMLSAFFNKKKNTASVMEGSGFDIGSKKSFTGGSGDAGDPAQTRHELVGEGSGESDFGGESNPKIMSLQRLLSSEEGNEFSNMKQNVEHFFEPKNSQQESNFMQTKNPSNYLESNLAALTPESSFTSPNAFNTQSGLSAGATGSRLTMSQTQETKWVRPDVSSELASVMPENNIPAESRTISTQAPTSAFAMYTQPETNNYMQRFSYVPSSAPSQSNRGNVARHQQIATSKSLMPTTSSTSSATTGTEKSQLWTTTARSSVTERKNFEGSLFDNVKVTKANIEHEPTKMFKEDDFANPGAREEKSQRKSQFFMSGTPKQPAIESAQFLSNAPVIRGGENGVFRQDDRAASRSSIKQSNSGYTWQQYMPFGTGIWEKESHIPTKLSTTSAYVPNNINNNNVLNEKAYMRGNIYKSDNREMFSAGSPNEGTYRSQEADDGARFASQRQSLVNAVSSGGRMSMMGENAVTRSGVEGSNDQGKQKDGSKPTKSPVIPSTELGIPQVIASEPRLKAVSEKQIQAVATHESPLSGGQPASLSQQRSTTQTGSQRQQIATNQQQQQQTFAMVPQAKHIETAHKKNLIKHKPDLDCGEGWEGASGDFGTFCYKFMNVKTVFDDAEAECKRINSNLFSILNPYENRYLRDNFHEKLWIGYRDKGISGTWNWTDGSRGIYTNWGSEADDDNGQRRDCVVLKSEDGKWKDLPCTSTLPFLCKHKSDQCPRDWKKLNLNSVSGCYHLFQEKKTWEDAEQECQNYDAHLISIISEDEQTMIYQVYSSKNYWIGYNDKDSEGDWIWSDRLTSSYTNWDDNSPNNGGVTCAAFAQGGHWHDEPCMEKLPFVCKRKGPKGEKVLGINDEGILKPVSRLLDKDEAARRNEQISKGGPKPVVPSQYWPLLKNTKSGLSGNRRLAVHGNLTVAPGGIALNGINQYLDGGDFHGKCISDPDKCSKGLSVAIQVYFDDSVRKYVEPHCVLDTSGGSKGFTIYIQKNKMHYKVITREKVWELATDITTKRWQDIVMTWHNYKGITVFVNGALKDSAENGKKTGILREDATPRLLISRRATDIKPFAYTKMVIASLAVFSKQLSIEDVTYAFTYDDTVVANYRWLMPHLVGQTIPSASEIFVQRDVGDMDGGLAIDGEKGWLEIKDFDPCLVDPSECHHGFSISFKLKLDQDVREYKDTRYIIDSGGHKDGVKGISVYVLNDNLYFQVIMSPEEDIMIWTVRTPIYTVRWQRLVMSWRLDKGLWVYVDGAFKGLTKTPKTLPVVFKKEPELLVVGRKNVGPDFKGAKFGIGSLAIFSRFLTRKETEHVFAVKYNPFPGLIREVWHDIPGASMSQLKANPDYPNNPSNIEVIENFDAPFDIEKDYGSKLKGYFVAPETGNYTFYMSCSKSCELYRTGDEDMKNKTKIIELNKATWHNQWNKYQNQTSNENYMIAGKYYYLEAVQKGEESSDSLSVGVRLPSGRYQRPVNKENLQWRLKGNPYAGVIREVWFDVPGYQISDLTSDPNFPNNPSSTEVLDKFDAPFNIDDNYGSRLSGYFRAPETGDYRFYLASDSTGELWLSSDDSESNLVKIVTLNGWTDHNQWLKFPEQRSDKVYLVAGKYYYIRAYQKADKLGDCVSVAVELPSGHFEGPIKRKHLSWKLPGGKIGPGPNDISEALPKPMGLYQLNEASLRNIISGDNGLIIHNIELTTGPDGVKDTAFEFKGKQDSYLEIPNDKHKLDAKNSITILANIYPTGEDGPILNYKKNGWGVHIWQFDKTMLFVRFVSRDDDMTTQPLATRVLQLNAWNQVGASYDNNTGVSQLWHDGKMVKSRNIGQLELSTQYPIRVGAREGDDRYFKGKVACIQIYGKALSEQQIGELRRCPKDEGQQTDSLLAMTQGGSGSELSSEDSYAMENRVGEDTEEELVANKCDPNPCINGAKCVNDERKVDGYKCLCTSDFTGKNCQVSKPAAENPVVKRMVIPKYPKAISSESYSKPKVNLPSKPAEEEREDVFLLYQKLGCYKDDAKRHDLPNPVQVKAITQEECVRACALQDKGFAYFGLQNGKDCFCGKHYGKYGKVDNKLCAKTCEGNSMENCGGDGVNQMFFFGLGTNYTVKTFTGNQFGSGTDAKIFMELIGDRGSSDFRQLDSSLSKFEPGSVDTKTFIMPDLGELKKIRVLHDNSGAAPSWFLKKITVTDDEGNTAEFPCNDWLSDTQGGGKLERELIRKPTTTATKLPNKTK